MNYLLRDYLSMTAFLFLLRLGGAFLFQDRSPDSLTWLESFLLSQDHLRHLQANGWASFAWVALLRSLIVAVIATLLLFVTGYLTGARDEVS